jgi:hypothetical protein
MLGTVPLTILVGAVLLSEELSDVLSDDVDHRANAWPVQAILVRPCCDRMRVEKRVAARFGLVALDVCLDLVSLRGHENLQRLMAIR